MVIIFNELGIITSVSYDTIRQGSVGNEIEARFEGKSNLTTIAKLNYTRPDGSHIDNIVMEPDSEFQNGFVKSLDDVWYTAISGTATLTIYLYDNNGNIIANGQETFDIEETDYYEEQGTITPEQYDSLLTSLASYNTALKEYSDNGNVVEINADSSSGTLTDEQVAILSHKNSKIIFTGLVGNVPLTRNIFYKTDDNNGYIVFWCYDVAISRDGYTSVNSLVIEVYTSSSENRWESSLVEKYRFYNKDQADSLFAGINQILNDIFNGQQIVGKARQDALGQNIAETYETKNDAQTKLQTAKDYTDAEVNKIKNGNYVSKKAEQDKDGNQIDTTYVKHNQVVSNFNSDSATDPLSASMGKELKRLIDNINAILQSDDTDLDTIQEIVDFIQNNKDVIDTISTTKINYTDIVDALNSSAVNKVLSANQGRILKGFIDDIVNGTTTVGRATESESATYDGAGNKIDEYYFSHEDGFAVGLVDVDDYDEDTGIITLLYNSTAISDISYNSDTGVITFTY